MWVNLAMLLITDHRLLRGWPAVEYRDEEHSRVNDDYKRWHDPCPQC
jgi:hypothetical protein